MNDWAALYICGSSCLDHSDAHCLPRNRPTALATILIFLVLHDIYMLLNSFKIASSPLTI